MDVTRFTERKTGQLVKISFPYADHSFMPDPLPPTWKLPYGDWQALADAKQALGELDGIGRTLPNPELLLQPLQQREALRSSSLEGTYATPEQVLLFELEEETSEEGDRSEPWREVSNYRRALRDGWTSVLERPVSLSLVKELHARLMHGVRGDDKHPGEWRRSQVYIGADRRFVPPPSDRLQDCLGPLEQFMEEPPAGVDPLVHAYLVHYQLEAIHPFSDGNGRVGRLLLALMTALGCGLQMPWLYMSAFFERHRDEYIDRLFNVSAEGAWTEWIRFCIDGTIQQARDAIRRCDLLSEARSDMNTLVSGGSGRLHTIVERLYSVPVLTIPSVRDAFGVTYPTAKSDVDRLVELGILRELPRRRRPKAYFAPRVFAIAYGNLEDLEHPGERGGTEL